METAAPLKSEIGDGRRRLLFRDAVAAMPLSSFFFWKRSSKPSKHTNKTEKDGTLFATDGWLWLSILRSEACASSVYANGTYKDDEKLGAGTGMVFGMCGGGRQPYPVLDALLSFFHLSTWKHSDQLMIGTSTFSLPPFSKLVDTPRVYKTIHNR
jgi:hypothetical protein